MARRNELVQIQKRGYSVCADCGGLVLSDDPAWLGEDDNGQGWFEWAFRCDDCGRWAKESNPE